MIKIIPVITYTINGLLIKEKDLIIVEYMTSQGPQTICGFVNNTKVDRFDVEEFGLWYTTIKLSDIMNITK